MANATLAMVAALAAVAATPPAMRRNPHGPCPGCKCKHEVRGVGGVVRCHSCGCVLQAPVRAPEVRL